MIMTFYDDNFFINDHEGKWDSTGYDVQKGGPLRQYSKLKGTHLPRMTWYNIGLKRLERRSESGDMVQLYKIMSEIEKKNWYACPIMKTARGAHR